MMTLTEFNKAYIYVPDTTVDNWQVLTPLNGKYYGDCEDYCLTLQAKVDGFKDIELYYCKYNGEGHCIGKIGYQWIDCGLQRLVESLPPQYTDLRKYWKIEIVIKKLIGKVLRWYKNL